MTVVDLPLVILNSQKLGCIEALSTRAAGLAFDAAQPAFIGSCAGQAARSVPRGNLILVAYQRHAPAGTLQAQLEQDAEQYRQALQPLAAAVQQQDSNAIAQALDRVTQADARLSARLEAMQSLILSRPAVDQPVQDVLERLRSFQARSLVLDLSLAETLMARQAKQMPQSDLAGAIGAALASIDDVERAAAPLDLSAPAGRSLLQIQSVNATITPGQQLQIDVDVQNIGASPSVDGQLHLMSKDALGAIAAQTSLDAIAPGDEARVTLHAPLQAGGTFTLQLWTSDGLQDLYLAALPQSMGAPSTTPGSAQPSLRVDVPAIGAAVLLWSWPIGIGVVMMLAAVAFGSIHRSRRRRTNAPTKYAGYGEETRRAEARERVALRRPPADVPARQQDPPAIRSTAATEPHTPVAASGAAIAQTPMPSAAPIPSPAIVRQSDDQKLSILLLLFTRDVVPKVPAIKVALAAATLRGQPLRDWLSPSVILRVGVDPRAHDPEWARTFGNEQLRRLMGAQFSPEHVETMRFGAGTEITGTILGHWASNDDSDDTSPRQA
ncbi:MAG: hypothetical protein IPO81_15910 [Kouleothrix sp.]|nr:hypothetical protein [Kouleothrix sp.]